VDDMITTESMSEGIHNVDLTGVDDLVLLKSVSGHFLINGGLGADNVTVSSDDALLHYINALLASI